jgi:hypothetical protein
MFQSWKSQNKGRGQNFVELALTLPIILVLFFGMIEVGFAIHSYVVVANGAREGARFGARGVHVPLIDIAGIVETSMSKSISVDLDGVDANTTIIVTQIDIENDGTYDIYGSFIDGDLAVVSEICEPTATPCDANSLEVKDFIDANLLFNASTELCQKAAGCMGDFVVVEIFHSLEPAVISGLVRGFIPYPFSINSTAVMRVLHQRAPS